jgi:hypothetical protein
MGFLVIVFGFFGACDAARVPCHLAGIFAAV